MPLFAGLTQQYKMSQWSEHCVRPWNKELCTEAKFRRGKVRFLPNLFPFSCWFQ